MYIDTVAIFQGLFILLIIGLALAKEWKALLYILGGALLILGVLSTVHFAGALGLFIFLVILCALWFFVTRK